MQDVGDVPARCHNVAHNVGAFGTRSVAIIVAVNGALLRNGQRRWAPVSPQPRPCPPSYMPTTPTSSVPPHPAVCLPPRPALCRPTQLHAHHPTSSVPPHPATCRAYHAACSGFARPPTKSSVLGGAFSWLAAAGWASIPGVSPKLATRTSSIDCIVKGRRVRGRVCGTNWQQCVRGLGSSPAVTPAASKWTVDCHGMSS